MKHLLKVVALALVLTGSANAETESVLPQNIHIKVIALPTEMEGLRPLSMAEQQLVVNEVEAFEPTRVFNLTGELTSLLTSRDLSVLELPSRTHVDLEAVRFWAKRNSAEEAFGTFLKSYQQHLDAQAKLFNKPAGFKEALQMISSASYARHQMGVYLNMLEFGADDEQPAVKALMDLSKSAITACARMLQSIESNERVVMVIPAAIAYDVHRCVANSTVLLYNDYNVKPEYQTANKLHTKPNVEVLQIVQLPIRELYRSRAIYDTEDYMQIKKSFINDLNTVIDRYASLSPDKMISLLDTHQAALKYEHFLEGALIESNDILAKFIFPLAKKSGLKQLIFVQPEVNSPTDLTQLQWLNTPKFLKLMAFLTSRVESANEIDDAVIHKLTLEQWIRQQHRADFYVSHYQYVTDSLFLGAGKNQFGARADYFLNNQGMKFLAHIRQATENSYQRIFALVNTGSMPYVARYIELDQTTKELKAP